MTSELYNEIAFQFIDCWMTNREEGKAIDEYLRNKNVNRIGIYGYGALGKHLVAELLNSDIEIAWIMDRKDMNIDNGLRFVRVSDSKGEDNPELIIVASIRYYEEIEKELIDRGFKNICSIEELVEEMRYWNR